MGQVTTPPVVPKRLDQIFRVNAVDQAKPWLDALSHKMRQDNRVRPPPAGGLKSFRELPQLAVAAKLGQLVGKRFKFMAQRQVQRVLDREIAFHSRLGAARKQSPRPIVILAHDDRLSGEAIARFDACQLPGAIIGPDWHVPSAVRQMSTQANGAASKAR